MARKDSSPGTATLDDERKMISAIVLVRGREKIAKEESLPPYLVVGVAAAESFVCSCCCGIVNNGSTAQLGSGVG